MGKGQSTLEKHGYKTISQTKQTVVATKGDEEFVIKKIPRDAGGEVILEIEILMETNHPHIVSSRNSFKDGNVFYVVTDSCQGRSLAEKVRKGIRHSESEALSWIVEICMALRIIHEKGLLHKNLMPRNIFLKEFGTVCLGEFGRVHESGSSKASSSNLRNCLAPEVLTEQTFDAKSDIWALGCILYELCTRKPAFSANSNVELIPMITNGPYPALPEDFSPQLRDLLSDIFKKDPLLRPTATEIMGHPYIMSSLLKKCKKTVADLQMKLQTLRPAADSLERVHQCSTSVSLAGGVVAAAGGILCITSTVLALLTLVSTFTVFGGFYSTHAIMGWVGIAVGMAGGFTTCTLNIRDMVYQTSKRKAIRSVVREFNEKTNAVVIWLREISNSIQTVRGRCDPADIEVRDLVQRNLERVGLSAGRVLGGVGELTRPVRVITACRIAQEIFRIVRVVGVVACFILAADIFSIRWDVNELRNIKRAKAHARQSVSEREAKNLTATTDQGSLLPSTRISPNTYRSKSETMRYVSSVRQTADELQEVLDELKSIIVSIPSVGAQGEQEWQDMEFM